MAEHIVAVFRSEEAAAAAEQSLQKAGISRSVIRRYAASESNLNEVAPAERPMQRGVVSGPGYLARNRHRRQRVLPIHTTPMIARRRRATS